MPLLAIQFNSFECGGIAIGVCISHKIADFMSLVTFLATWAAKARGKDEEIVSPNFHLASHLFPPLDEESPFPRFRQCAKTVKLITKRFVFDKEKIAALRDESSSAAAAASQQQPDMIIKDPTRVEAVSAFLWKYFIAISSKFKAKNIFAALIAVNLRPRMSLPSESFAFRNLSTAAAPLLMPSEEEDNHEYHNLVWHLRIRKINSDHINTVQSGLPHLCHTNKAIDNLLSKPEMSHCSFIRWCRFPVYEVDFSWGKPVSVCTVLPRRENAAILMSTRCGEGIEAWVSILENELALLPDELLSLATDDTI